MQPVVSVIVKTFFVPLLLIFAPVSAIADVPTDEPVEEWAGYIPADELDGFDSDDVTEALFRLIDDVEVFDLDLGDDSDLELSIKRKIFRNPGHYVTWTVVDKIFVENDTNLRWNLDDFEGGGIGPIFGSQVGVQLTNIKQIRPEDYPDLMSTEEMLSGVRESDWYRELNGDRSGMRRIEGASDLQVMGLNEEDDGSWWGKLCPFDEDDTENRNRFCNILDRITFPYRFPRQADDMEDLSDGEIMSYNISGSLSFGVGANWSAIPNDILGLIRAGARVKIFLRGYYQVLVQKENERYARVKVSEADSRGNTFGVKSKVGTRVLDGIFLVENLDGALEIVPFDYEVERSEGQRFEVSYRYDLENEAAQHAFARAVRGDLGPSSDLAITHDGEFRDINENGVARLFTQETRERYFSEDSKVEFSFIFRHDRETRYRTIEITFTTPEGTRHRYQAISSSEKRYRDFVAWYERFLYRFSVLLNLDEIDEDDPDGRGFNHALRLIVEGDIRDGRTESTEMVSYILEVEDSLSQPGLFFRPPEQMKSGDDHELPIEHLGGSRYYYALKFGPQEIQQFAQATEEERWAALERAFGKEAGDWSGFWSRQWYKLWRAPLALLNVPLYLAGATIRSGSDIYHAERIEDKWEELAEEEDAREFTAELARTFYDRFYSYELVRVLRTILHESQVDYHAVGVTEFSENKSLAGTTAINKRNLATTDYKRRKGDKGAELITHAALERDGELLMLRFQLEEKPRAVHVSLRTDEKGDEEKFSGDFLLHNRGSRFLPGWNELVIDGSDESHPLHNLVRKLDNSLNQSVTLKGTLLGREWSEGFVIRTNN